MATKLTAFRPSVHGFKFNNSFSAEEIMEELYSIPSWMTPDDNWGLCGGMCFAALDRYFRGDPIPTTTSTPDGGDSLFKELARRQSDSVHSVRVSKILDYQIRPNEEAWYEPMDSLGLKTQTTQWNSIKSKIDNGIPTTICLIRSGRLELHKIGDNHQVVVWGYTYDSSNKKLKLNVYDPNKPDNDNVIVGITKGQENSELDAYQTPGPDPRGFLRVPYDRTEVYITAEEAALASAPPEELEWIWTVFS